MRKYRYRVEKTINERKIVFEIVITAANDTAAMLQAGELGIAMGCLLIGPLLWENDVWSFRPQTDAQWRHL